MSFIVIEGLDGSGKSTASKLLASRFAEAHLPCIHTYEPTKRQIGQLIRSMLAGDTEPAYIESMAQLFAADRYEHIWKDIQPYIADNNIVCDRYYLSNMAYQSFDTQSLENVIYYNRSAIENTKPDITFFLNISPEECVKRINSRGQDKSIYETLEGLKQIYERYLIAIDRMKETDNIVFVGCDTATPQEIVDEMWVHILPMHTTVY